MVKKEQKNGSYYFCVSVISINLVSNADKDHYMYYWKNANR